MKRRDFLKAATAALIGAGAAPRAFAQVISAASRQLGEVGSPRSIDDHIRDYLYKMRHFDEPHPDDIRLDAEQFSLLTSTVKRLRRLERTAGHGNFQVLSFDEALKLAMKYSAVGPFQKRELDFLEQVFYTDASRYGFLGKKPLENLTVRIPDREVTKVPYTGNYLYRGHAVDAYEKIRHEIGENAVLTSGVRSVVKQFLLFLNKAYKSGGNLSLASRSLAPPGFSYHGVGDFDVGQIDLGADNFTERFVSTPVYGRLKELGYLTLRYDRDNLLGVRFEPWHIRMDQVA